MMGLHAIEVGSHRVKRNRHCERVRRRRQLWGGIGLLVLGAASASGHSSSAAAAREPSAAQRQEVLQRLDGLPLSFIENQGQTDPAVVYYLQHPAVQAYFTAKGVTLRLTEEEGGASRAHGLRIELVGGSAKIAIESVERAPGVVSYFQGSCEQWKTGIPTSTEIAYRQPWPGVDLHYRGQEGKLEAVYVVAPGADPATIRVRYLGQQALKLDESGNLQIDTPLGDLQISAPILYQEIAGQRVRVEGRFVMAEADTVTFHVGTYDHQNPLIIDPTLAYAGYIGGNRYDEGFGVAVDSSGAAYVTGGTNSRSDTFPVTVGPDLTYNSVGYGVDAFVAKVNPSGTALVYAGYIGGNHDDSGFAIAVDSSGAAYVTGSTLSTEATFPVTVGPDLTYNGGDHSGDAFVAKVNPSGTALEYAGYIGGSESDAGSSIAVDSSGAAYVTGYTESTEATFPVAVGPDESYNGGSADAFVAKVNPSGTALVYAGYIGGKGSDPGLGIALDNSGAVYVTGYTDSTEATFPVTVGPDLSHNGGGLDAFVAKVNPSGTALEYAGYIGGNLWDVGEGIAVDTNGAVYVTGSTLSTEATFPVTVGPDLTSNLDFDAFVAKVNPSGTALVYAGYVGGDDGDEGIGIALDSTGAAYVTGYTESREATFPVTVGPDVTYNAAGSDGEAFVAKVNPSGTALVYAGYVGGKLGAVGGGIAVDSSGAAYVTGSTYGGAGFPVTVGPDLTYNGFSSDGFVAKVTAGSRIRNPAITTIKSQISEPGSAASIRGTGFSTLVEKNVVYFDGYKAKVMKANTTVLDVKIPIRSKRGVVEVHVVANGLPSNRVQFTVK